MFSIVTYICVIVGAIGSDAIITPCNVHDEPCLLQMTKSLYEEAITENEQLGTENLDPMKHTKIRADLPGVRYTLTDVTVNGFKNCSFIHVKKDMESMTLYLDMACSYFAFIGNYEIDGHLAPDVPIEGKGYLNITCGLYGIEFYGNLIIVDNNGKKCIQIGNYQLKLNPIGKVTYLLNNLHNGNKALSDKTHDYMDDNWIQVAKRLGPPIFDADFKKIVNNVNLKLKTVDRAKLYKE